MPTPSAPEDSDQHIAAGEPANGRTANAYTYQDLDENKSQIRLIQLQPGSQGSPIVVSLSTLDFLPGDNAELQYEALSYTWGNSNDKTRIEIEAAGEHEQSRFLSVPTNCYEALHTLRYADRSRTLWIDAICINQTDDNEKGHQVAMMADIYREAAKVTAWVGQASETSDIAFEYIREVCSHVSVDPETHELVFLSEDSRWIDDGGDALIMEHQTAALAELLSRPWFSRVWIWQEIRLGHSRASLTCGDFEIPWSAFRAVMYYLKGKTIHGPSHLKLTASLDDIYDLCDMRGGSVFSLLNEMRTSGCSDRRDRVFAVRGIVKKEMQAIFGQPDYTKSWQTVFSSLCVDYARQVSSLEFLRYTADHKEAGLPSWVPSWTSELSGVTTHGNGWASGPSRCALFGSDERYLTVGGRLVTTVHAVISYGTAGTWAEHSTTKHRQALIKLLKSIGRHVTLHDGHADLSALVEVLTIGRFSEAYMPPENISKLEHFANAIQVVPTWPEDEELLAAAVQQIAGKYLLAVNYMTENCFGASFVLAVDGKFGLAPGSTRPGDIISVLLGCDSPIVLRPTVDAKYEVIGAAYIGGIMQGQSLLGPLPPHYRFLWYRHRGNEDPAFRDDLNNLVRLTDPRLPPLPSEWRYVGSLDDPDDVAFENVQTGERRGHWQDPRMDADVLEARGIKLDTITLV